MTIFANGFYIETELITVRTVTYILIEKVFNGLALMKLKVQGLTILY